MLHDLILSTDPATVVFVSLVKASLLLALAQAVVATMHRLSAAAKHLILTAGLAAFLVVPLLASFGPEWRVTVARSVVVVQESAPTPDVWIPREDRNAPVLPSLWLAVSAVVLARLAWSAIRLRSILAGAVPASTRLHGLLDDARRRLSMRRRVRLLASDRVRVPMVWGVWSGTLLLPVAAEEWTDEELRATFIHELGHLRRLDSVSLALMNVVSALLWFHPQVWAARRRALAEGERACDDLVLRAGERASEYASHLLRVARSSPRHDGLPALLAMSRPSQLEGRMVSILSPAINRQSIGVKAFAIALAVFVVIAGPLSAMQLAEEIVTRVQRRVAPAAAPRAVSAPVAIATEPAAVRPVAVMAEPQSQPEPQPMVSVAEPAIEAAPAPAPEAAPQAVIAEPVPEAAPQVQPAPIAEADVLRIVPAEELVARPFRVVKQVRGRANTLKLARPVNTGDLARNPAEGLARRRLLESAAKQNADAVTNVKCSREIRIGIAWPTAVTCQGDAIVFTSE